MRLELALRLTLIAGLFVAIIENVPVWGLAPLGLIAISATAELAVRPYAANVADRVLLSCGAIVTAFILIGLGLNLTPWGLTRATWNVAWLIVSVGILAWRRGVVTKIGRPVAGSGSLSIWIVSASLILAAAIALSLAGIRYFDRQPVLAFSVVSEGSSGVAVEIEATSISASYQIEATSKVKKAHRYLSAPIRIAAGSNGELVKYLVPLNKPGAWTINLQSASSGAVVRWLKVYLR
jgi:hypothetical protein